MTSQLLALMGRLGVGSRIISDVYAEIRLNPMGTIFPFKTKDRLKVASEEAGLALASFEQALGQSSQPDRDSTAMRLGDISARMLCLPKEHVEALATDPDFNYREIAQACLRVRAVFEGNPEPTPDS